MSGYEQFAKTYNSSDLMKIIASMQLLPQNHGKEIRLMDIARMAVANLNNSSMPVPLYEMQQIIHREYAHSKDEDPPINLFTENVMSFLGNSIVFPGITESGTSILNNLIKAIFIHEGEEELPKTYKENIRSGLTLMLTLFNTVAERSGLRRNQIEKINGKRLQFPKDDKIEKLKEAVTFDNIWINNYCNDRKIQNRIIELFVIDQNDPSLLVGKPTDSPLYNRPLVKVEDEYILLQPSSGVGCLINFIWDKAKENRCYEVLLRLYHDIVWRETQIMVYKMQWGWMDITLPPSLDNLYCREGIFFFDLNKVVYICFIESGFKRTQSVGGFANIDNPPKEILEYAGLLKKRQYQVHEHLAKHFEPERIEVFTVYVISEVGFAQQYALPETNKNKLTLYFRFSELKHIIQLEESDPLLLWKFAKAYTETYEECEVKSLDGMLDIFVCYKVYEYSLWKRNEERPELIAIMPGQALPYICQSILKTDEHIAPISMGKERTAFEIVYKYCSYAPFYREVGSPETSPILLEDYRAPIWFVNEQAETQHEILIMSQQEMLAFWMYKLHPHIEKYFTFLEPYNPLKVKIVIDSRIKKEMRPDEIPAKSLDEIAIPIEVNDLQVILTIPLELLYWYAIPHNKGERHVMKTFLQSIIYKKTGLNKVEEISRIVDEVIPKGRAKISSMLNNVNNLRLENRNLPPYRPVQEADIAAIRINLTRGYGIKVGPNELSSLEGKNALCSRIAKTLHKKLLENLCQFDPDLLLPILLNGHEACVQQRAIRALDLPARIAALSNQEEQIIDLMHKEHDRAKTALALRCLIELIVAYDPIAGKQPPNFDDIDELVALMSEVIAWATLSDGIHLGLQNPSIKFLTCGRIEVDYVSLNSDFIPFDLTKNEIEINEYTEGYERLFHLPDEKPEYNSSPEVIEINQAFNAEWGMQLTRLHEFVIDLVELLRERNATVACIPESILFEELKKRRFKWTDDEITIALNVLTLVSGWKIGTPPKGYKKDDTYPWRYNRELSFLRRPIAKLVRDSQTYYYYSYRHLFAAFDNIMAMLFNGRLNAVNSGKLDELIKKNRIQKGKEFRDIVSEWLKSNSTFEVISYEVPIKPGAILSATKDYGDIDVLAIDHEGKIIYAIECKNTLESRAIHEMKTEMDKYLGRDGRTGMIQKHVERGKWLKENQNALKAFTYDADAYTIKSIIITSEHIPLVYLQADKLPLPFISFPKLKINGIGLLNST